MKFKIIIALIVLISFNSYSKEVTGTNNGIDYHYYEYNLDDNYFFLDNKDNNKYEVFYFYNYHCPSCYMFHPYILLWEKFFKEDNSIITKIPLNLKSEWKHNQDLFIFTKIYKIKSEQEIEIFKSLIDQNIKLSNKDLLKDFINSKFNISKTEIELKLNSSDYRILNENINMVNDFFKVTSTPTIIINHDDKRYIIDVEKNKTPSSILMALKIIIK